MLVDNTYISILGIVVLIYLFPTFADTLSLADLVCACSMLIRLFKN